MTADGYGEQEATTMTENPRYSDSNADSDHGSPPRMPRWVKMSAIIVAVLVLLAAAVVLIGGGDHGPGRHGARGDPSSAGIAAVPAPVAGGHR